METVLSIFKGFGKAGAELARLVAGHALRGAGIAARAGVAAVGAAAAGAGAGGWNLVSFLAGGALGVVGTIVGTYLLHKVSRALGRGS